MNQARIQRTRKNITYRQFDNTKLYANNKLLTYMPFGKQKD